MNRPSDWSAVGLQTDPTPGDPDAIGDAVRQWGTASETICRVRTGVNRVGQGVTPQVWEGKSGDAFRERLAPLPRLLGDWGRDVDDAGTAAAAWADAMRTHQGAADTALGLAVAAHADLQDAQTRLQGAQDAVDAVVVTGAPDMSDLVDMQDAVRAATRAVEDARSHIATHTRTVHEAKEDYDAAARQAARTITEITDHINRIADKLLPDAGLTYGQLQHASTATRLEWLENADPAVIAPMLKSHPGLAQEFWTNPPDPQAVAAWWAHLPAAARDLFTTDAAPIIGDLGGIPYSVRDTANRAILNREITVLRVIADPLVPTLESELRGLESIRAALTPAGSGPPRYLTELITGPAPLAAVSIGNLDDASNVTYTIPGMGTTAASMKDWAQSAQNIWGAQYYAGDHRPHAVVAWIGYKAPPVPPSTDLNFAVLGDEDAKAGGVLLDRTLTGFGATAAGRDVTVNVVAHSYGTTTAAFALTAPGVHVNTFVSVASAGLPAGITHGSDLHAGRVFAGQARDVIPGLETGKGDEWAWTGRDFSTAHPVNPVDPSFHASTFGADGSDGLKPVTDHATHTDTGTGYLDPGTESLHNIAYATTGHADRVIPYTPEPPTRLEKGLEAGMQAGPYGDVGMLGF